MERSTRLSILEHALTDVVERLGELPQSDEAAALRARARLYETEVALWEESPPEEETRVALLKCVLDLNVEVIRLGGSSSPPASFDRANAGDDGDGDDEYPKPV